MFADRLISAVREAGPLCVGIDPHPDLIPAIFGPPGPESAGEWSLAVLDRCVGRVAVVKPQVGLFERWGATGFAALEAVCRTARRAGLIVILDAKRGDIGSTAVGYAEAYLGPDAVCPSDCMTVNPWMGLDTLEPFLVLAEREERGVAVLVRTSNPGSRDFQSCESEGTPMYLRVAEALEPARARLRGASGWSGLMLVAGATAPDEARRIRAAAPDALFLVPGYGAQNGSASDAVAGFVRGPDQRLEGGVVNSSRAVTCPPAALSAQSLQAWNEAVDAAIAGAQADLNRAITLQ